MPDVILWILIGWVVMSLFGRTHGSQGACGRQTRLGAGRGEREELERKTRPRIEVKGKTSGPRRVPRERGEVRRMAVDQPRRAPLTKAERESRLRTRYVAGEITVEEYEAELDDLYRRA